MPTYTVTFVEVVQLEFEADDPTGAIEQFLASESNDGSLDLEAGFRVMEGSSHGEDWLDFAADMDQSTWYDNERCDVPGCQDFLVGGACENDDDEVHQKYLAKEK